MYVCIYEISSPFFSPPQFMMTQQQEEGEGGKEEEEGDEADDLVRNVVSCLQLRLEGFLACTRECTFCDNYDKKAVLAESEPTQFPNYGGSFAASCTNTLLVMYTEHTSAVSD